jgi:hypothetical protein
MLCIADGHLADYALFILTPTAPCIVAHIPHYSSRNRILVDITQKRDEVCHIVDRLTLKSVLEQVSRVLMSIVVILRIGDGDSPDRLRDTLFTFTNQQMYMIGHQTVSIDNALWR